MNEDLDQAELLNIPIEIEELNLLQETRERFKELYQLESPEEIAAFLRFNNITGYKGIADSCPIAKYLKTGQPDVVVEVSTIGVTIDHTTYDVEVETYSISFPMDQFIRRFDLGDFDYLSAQYGWETCYE